MRSAPPRKRARDPARGMRAPDGPRGEIGHCPADDEAELAIRAILEAGLPTLGVHGRGTGARPPGDRRAQCLVRRPQRRHQHDAARLPRSRHLHWPGAQRAPVLGVVCAVDAPDDRGDLICLGRRLRTHPAQRRPSPASHMAEQLRPDDVVGAVAGGQPESGWLSQCVAPARYVSCPSIAYRLALVATGDYVATLSLNYLREWDFAAGHALVRAVGGVLVDERGHRNHVYAPKVRKRRHARFRGSPASRAGLMQRRWEGTSRSGFGDARPPPDVAPVRAQVGKLVHDPGVLSRAQGCLLGQLAGDALGALVEFQSPRITSPRATRRVVRDSSPLAVRTPSPPASRPTIPSWRSCWRAAWSCSAGFDQEAVTAGYAAWYDGWTHALEPRRAATAGVGRSTLAAPRLGPWARSPPTDVRDHHAAQRARAAANEHSQANGALMRVSPLGVWGALRDAASTADAARRDAQLTHPHAGCQSASAVFATTLAAAIREGLSPQQTHAFALNWLRQHDARLGAPRKLSRLLGSRRPRTITHSRAGCWSRCRTRSFNFCTPRVSKRGGRHRAQRRRYRHQCRHLWGAPRRRPWSRRHPRAMAAHGPVVSTHTRPAWRSAATTCRLLADRRAHPCRTSDSGLIFDIFSRNSGDPAFIQAQCVGRPTNLATCRPPPSASCSPTSSARRSTWCAWATSAGMRC